jgi:hypothetical protein
MKKMDKVDGPDKEKYEWIKMEFLMDPDNQPTSTPNILLSSRMDSIPRGLDQVGDGLL